MRRSIPHSEHHTCHPPGNPGSPCTPGSSHIAGSSGNAKALSPLSRLAAAALLLVFVMSSGALADVRGHVERAVRGAHLGGAEVSISVRDAETDAEIIAVDARRPMIPASNMKLLTSGAALHILGSDFHFETKLLHDEEANRLIIIGSGDPAFGDPALLEVMSLKGEDGLGVEQFLAIWIDAVMEAGITEVDELVVDDRIFDREFVHDRWPADQLNRRYCAQVAGFNFHRNVLHVYPSPIAGARPDISQFEPHANWLEMGNSATSRQGANDSNTAWIARRMGTNRLRLYGNVKHAYRTPVPVTLHDMPSFFARLFADRLGRRGVEVGSYRVADPHEPPLTGTRIGPVIATPIETIITRCNRDSQNLYAEALLKRIGAELTNQPGSWSNGAAILRHTVRDRLDSASLALSVRVSDGSGLSRDNRVSPETLTAWLNSFHVDEEVGEIFVTSLARPGGRGTLRNRFRDVDLYGADVRAKSGYINQVSTLSGFITMPDGRRRSFSVLINGIPDSRALRNARNLQEEVVGIIARDMSQTPARLGSD